MTTKFLPILKSGTENQLTESAVVGAWYSTKQLKELSQAIAVSPGATNIYSIPHPWARLFLFDSVLFPEKKETADGTQAQSARESTAQHPLYPKIRGEWRGLLAILGLREMRGFKELSATPVSFKKETKPNSFISTVAQLLPDSLPAIHAGVTWESLHLLRWKGLQTKGEERAFAITSPSTLVATGVDYSKILDAHEIPWLVDGVLVDPKDKLNPEERQALAQWILQVKDALKKPSPTPRHSEINIALSAFAEDLCPTEQIKSSDEVLSAESWSLDGVNLFKVLDRPHKFNPNKISDAFIVTDRGNAPSYVLVDSHLAGAWDLPERDIKIYGTISLATVGRDLPDTRQKNSGVFPKRDGITPANWCTADFFFQSELIYEEQTMGTGVDASVSFPGCLPVKIKGESRRRNPAFPLTAEALKLFTAESLQENFTLYWLTPSADKDAPIAKAELKLHVRQKNVNDGLTASETRTITIEHTYYQSNRCPVLKLPALCIWPNLRFEDKKEDGHEQAPQGAQNQAPTIEGCWSRYYLFQSWRGFASTSGQPASAVFSVTPPEGGEYRLVSDSEDTYRITLMNQFPDALICTMPFGDKPRINDRYPPKALLLLARPKAKTALGVKKAVLGIDFGTTGTSLYRAYSQNEVGGEDVLPVNLVNRVFQITGYAERDFQRLITEDFLPADERKTANIQSIFQDFDTTLDVPRLPLKDGHVLFVPKIGLPSFSTEGERVIFSNLKWGSGHEQIAAQDFLSQLCLQAVAQMLDEGANSIDIRYSYPTAFIAKNIRDLKLTWESVVNEIIAATGNSVTITHNQIGLNNCEAVAATRFFAHEANEERLDAGRGAITMDIGGGTTDIAIWDVAEGINEPALRSHLSVLFAGQDIFLSALRKWPALLTYIDRDKESVITGYVRLLNNKEYIDHKPAYNALLDALISVKGEELIKLLRKQTKEPVVQDFLDIIKLGLCGLGFYTGLVIGPLVKEGGFGASSTSSIPVFVGGNGSKLFHWCEFGALEKESEIITDFGQSLLAGATIAAGDKLKGKIVAVSLSRLPKQEVAYGLVVNDNTRSADKKTAEDKAQKANRNAPAGENYWVGAVDKGELRDWSTALDIELLRSMQVQADPKMKIFGKFLESVNLKSANEELSADTLRELDKAVGLGITDQKKPDSRMQPIFFMALKYMIAEKINALVRKYGA